MALPSGMNRTVLLSGLKERRSELTRELAHIRTSIAEAEKLGGKAGTNRAAGLRILEVDRQTELRAVDDELARLERPR